MFRPEAINTTIFAGAPTRNIGDLRDFFFFAPFATLPEIGYSVRVLHASLLGTVSWLGKNLGENLNGGQGPNWPAYASELSLESLASRFATNRTSLNKRFNAANGMSAMAYVNSVAWPSPRRFPPLP